MNRTTRQQREYWIARAVQLMRHDDTLEIWRVTNRDQVLAALVREFGISKRSARMALLHASARYNEIRRVYPNAPELWEL